MIQLKHAFLWLTALALIGVTYAQQAEQSGTKPKPKGNAFLSGGQYGTGNIPLATFDALIGKAPIAKDSLGRECAVHSFDLTFAERGIFEDSTGRLTIMTDYYTTKSEDGKLDSFWVKELQYRAKIGDTVYMDNIVATYPDTAALHYFYTYPLKLVITE